MKKLEILILILTFSLIGFAQNQSPTPVIKSNITKQINNKEYYLHTVEKGQTLYSISKAYSQSIENIARENPGVLDGLRIKQVLKIPSSGLSKNTNAPIKTQTPRFDPKDFDFIYHVSRENETIEEIASIYLVTPEDIKFANPKLNSNSFGKNEYVKIPVISKKSTQRKANLIKPKTGNNSSAKPKTSQNKTPTSNNSNSSNNSKSPQIISATSNTNESEERISSKDIPARPTNKYLFHTVKKDETLYSISQYYSIPVDRIKNANPNPVDNLKTGQIIRIPQKYNIEKPIVKKAIIQDEKTEYINHVVKKKETLYRIAIQYKVSIDSLKEWNPGLTLNLKIGQIIRIQKKKRLNDFILHKAVKKEKLKRIAQDYNINIYNILEINPKLGNKVFKGQTIKIPVEPDIIEPEEIIEEKIKETEKVFKPNNIDSINCGNYFINRGIIYNVALMLPFYLDDLDQLNYPDSIMDEIDFESLPYEYEKSFRFLQFYEGFMIAVDSLNKSGMQINLFVYDLGNDDDQATEILRNREFMFMDLIIGPVFSKSFAVISEFAKIHNISIVNPFSSREEILFQNPNVYKIQSSEYDQYNNVIDFVINNFSDDNIMVVRQTSYTEALLSSQLFFGISDLIHDSVYFQNYELLNILEEINFMDSISYIDTIDVVDWDTSLHKIPYTNDFSIENTLVFRDSLESLPDDSTLFLNSVKEIIYSRDSVAGIAKNASVCRDNTILVSTRNNVFAINLITQLYQIADSMNINLICLPRWDKFCELDSKYLIKLKSNIFSQHFIDYDDNNVKRFVLDFRSKFKTEPLQYSFEGFDIAWYFLNALNSFGRDFQDCLPYFDINLLHTKFIFEKKWQGGFENKHWNIYKYQDFKLLDMNKKIPEPIFEYKN
ncbi:MAG: LysM peptidoglycan-binding domain-containing protein [Bacteroidales bacterium]|nr:LysM peptidoglycan-binding domain-containing protein [Bacteroidales bacterium]